MEKENQKGNDKNPSKNGKKKKHILEILSDASDTLTNVTELYDRGYIRGKTKKNIK